MSSGSPNTSPASGSDELRSVAPATTPLDQALLSDFFQQQNFLFGIVGGVATAILGALAWAVVTIASGYQIGRLVFCAIAVYEGYKFSFRQISDEGLELIVKRQSPAKLLVS